MVKGVYKRSDVKGCKNEMLQVDGIVERCFKS